MSNPWAAGPAAPALPAPAWYPDPSGIGEYRYWDGSQWTLGVVIGGQVSERPMPWPPQAPNTNGGNGTPAPQYQPQWGQPYVQPQPQYTQPQYTQPQYQPQWGQQYVQPQPQYVPYPTTTPYGGYYQPYGYVAPPKPPDERIELPGAALGYALVGFIVGLVLGIGLGFGVDLLGAPDIVILLVNVAGLWTGLLGACYLASRRWGTGNIAFDFGLKIQWGDFGWGLLMSLAARVAGAIVAIPFVFFPRLLDNNSDAYGRVADNWGSFLLFAAVAIIGAPIVEELFFRGLLLRALTRKLGVVLAIAVQAVLFGMAHFSPILGLVNITVITVITAAGVVFGITATWRRVGTSVVAHSAFNFIAVLAAALLNFGLLTR